MVVRYATTGDAATMALIMAAVAEEGLIGTEPPVDVDARAEGFRSSIEAEGPGASWVLEDAGRIVGHVVVREQAPGVLYLGMAILRDARRTGRRASASASGPGPRRSDWCAQTRTAVGTEASEARS
jgi:putative acetyltransferase